MSKSKLLIIGAKPDTAGIGGVSIHVERLIYWLKNSSHQFDFCDYKKESIWKVVRLISSHQVIHIHPSNPVFRLFLVCVSKAFRKRVIFTIHGDLGRFGRFKNLLDKWAVKWCDIPIAINEGSYKKALEYNPNSTLISAYLPPFSDGYLPSEIIEKINELRLNNKVIVATNASVCSYTAEGKEIYGIDFLIKYFKTQLDYYLFISDPSGQYTDKYKKDSLDNVVFIKGNHSFYALMKHSDMVIRATATDGDSLSVKEGLSLGIKVIATDSVSRPSGVVLFKYNDPDSLDVALRTSSQLDKFDQHDSLEKLIVLYNKLQLC